MSNEITVVRSALEKMAPQFKAALPKHVDVERFMRITMTAVQNQPDLLSTDRASLYSACMKAAQDGLLPDGREGAIITFGKKAAWMPMVAGIMKKVRNSGEISTWAVHIVKSGDRFEYFLGDSESITHRPAMKDRGETIAVYSIVVMKDGERSREVMGIDEIQSIRKRSRSPNAGPWSTDFDEMAKKTVIRRHSKRLPMSTDLDGAIHSDDDLYVPAVDKTTIPDQVPADDTPAKPKRPRGLQAVLDADDVETRETVDADGVIYEHDGHEPNDDNCPI